MALLAVLAPSGALGAALLLVAWPSAVSGYWGPEWPTPRSDVAGWTAAWAVVIAGLFALDPFGLTERVARRRERLGLATGDPASRLVLLVVVGTAVSAAGVIAAGMWLGAATMATIPEWQDPWGDAVRASLPLLALTGVVVRLVRPQRRRAG